MLNHIYRIANDKECHLLINFLKGKHQSRPERRSALKLLKYVEKIHLKKDFDSVKLMVDGREVVPRDGTTLRRTIFQYFHDGLGHLTRLETHQSISKRYFGISRKDVQEYIDRCPICAKRAMGVKRINERKRELVASA